jgi:PAS domain S-box-containing protein
MTALAATGPTRRFAGALATASTLALVFSVVLAGPFSASTREAVSAVGFATGALAIMGSGALAARRCVGRRRRSWLIVVSASGVALVGNLVTTVTGGDPVQDTSLVGDLLVALALVLTVFALLGLSDTPARRARLLVSWLDGVVTGCTVLVIAIVLVFSRLVEAENIAERPVVLVFPILDVAVLTVALLLFVRSRGDRSFYAMISFGFVLYAVADLAFAVQNAAQSSYEAGTPQDLMWITAYLILAAAAWHPAAARPTAVPAISSSVDVQSTLLIFGLLVAAAAVQSLFPGGPLTDTLTGLWVVLVLAVGVRQVLLVSDNQGLRAGLEQRVQEKTADLRRVNRRIEVMLNSVGDGIYGVDLEGRITFSNPSALVALGCTSGDLMGLHAHDALHAENAGSAPEAERHDWAGCYIAEAITERQVASRDDTYRRSDGSLFPVEVTASPLLDEDEILGAVVVFRDVTERREVDRMKDEFLSIVSHELRTPLTAIRGSLDMLSDGGLSKLPDPAQRMVTIATRSSERLTRLINDILDVERIRSGKLRMDRAPHEARLLLDSTYREMGPLASAAGLDLSLGNMDGTVFADADRIVQTLTNLVGNAIKFSTPGTTITLAARNGLDEVTFSVSDQGRGVPPDKLLSIFNPFEQVDSSDSREQGGTGLGLAICRGIVERHGGRIWVESEVGKGSTFYFTIPDMPTHNGGGGVKYRQNGDSDL